MKEIRTKGKARSGEKLDRVVSLADRMRTEAVHAAQQRSRQADSADSPNEYADSATRSGLDRVVCESGHFAVDISQDAYHLGANLYCQHQMKKQSGTGTSVYPIAEADNTPASNPFPGSMPFVQEETMTTGQGQPFVPAHIDISQDTAICSEQIPEQRKSVRTRSAHSSEPSFQSRAQEQGRQLAQRSFAKKQLENQKNAHKNSPVEPQGIAVDLQIGDRKNIRTKESAPSLPSEDNAKQVFSDPIESGQELAKKEARKQLLRAGERNRPGITVSTETTSAATPTPTKAFEPGAQQAAAASSKTTISASAEADLSEVKEKAFAPRGRRPIRKKTERTVGKSIRTIDHSIQETDNVQRKMARSAKKKMEKAIRSEQVRKAGQAAAAAASKASKAAAKIARAVAKAAKELTAAVAAGGGILLILVMLLVVVGIAGMMFARDDGDGETLPICADVKRYESVIRYYAKQHGIGDYVLLIEAVMMQESNGRTTDPMQCSECGFNTRYPREPGSITDPEYSIDVGIQYLAYCMDLAGVESPIDMDRIKIALQGYNYGDGYITWAISKYGEYSKANAIEFSLKMAEQMGWGGYGDKEYVPHVLRFYPIGQLFYEQDNAKVIVEVAASQIGNVGGEPYWRWYGFTEHVEWCACFVSWCANECGYITSGVLPKFAGCVNGVNWFKSRGKWQPGSYTPDSGDIIFFDWNKADIGQDGIADHVGIVEKVENGWVYTIEGNSGDMCRRRSYPVGSYQILGYGVFAIN